MSAPNSIHRPSRHVAVLLAIAAAALLLLTACPPGVGPDDNPLTAGLTSTAPPVVRPLGPLVARDDFGDEIVVYAYAVSSLLEGTTENYAGLQIEWMGRVGFGRDLSAGFPLPGGGTTEANVTQLLDLAYDGTEATDTILPMSGFGTARNGSPPWCVQPPSSACRRGKRCGSLTLSGSRAPRLRTWSAHSQKA